MKLYTVLTLLLLLGCKKAEETEQTIITLEQQKRVLTAACDSLEKENRLLREDISWKQVQNRKEALKIALSQINSALLKNQLEAHNRELHPQCLIPRDAFEKLHELELLFTIPSQELFNHYLSNATGVISMENNLLSSVDHYLDEDYEYNSLKSIVHLFILNGQYQEPEIYSAVLESIEKSCNSPLFIEPLMEFIWNRLITFVDWRTSSDAQRKRLIRDLQNTINEIDQIDFNAVLERYSNSELLYFENPEYEQNWSETQKMFFRAERRYPGSVKAIQKSIISWLGKNSLTEKES